MTCNKNFTFRNYLNFMRVTLFLIQLIFFSFAVSGQTFSGSMVDSQTNQPIAYVNIGILKKGVGTVSDEQGNFALIIEDQYSADTLRFSIIGYETKNYLVSDFRNQFQQHATITMKKSITELNEVVIKPGKIKYAELGNKFNSKSVTGGFQTNKLGSEVGTVMRIKKAPSYVERVTFRVAVNKYDSAIWRVNIYLMKDGLPGENMLKQPVYLKSYKSNEVLSLDLSQYMIEVNDDFLVSLELIQDLGERGLDFCAGFLGNSLFFRDASQGEWKKFPAGLGFSATVSYGY